MAPTNYSGHRHKGVDTLRRCLSGRENGCSGAPSTIGVGARHVISLGPSICEALRSEKIVSGYLYTMLRNIEPRQKRMHPELSKDMEYRAREALTVATAIFRPSFPDFFTHVLSAGAARAPALVCGTRPDRSHRGLCRSGTCRAL